MDKRIVAIDAGYGWTKAMSKYYIWQQPSIVGNSVGLLDEPQKTDVEYIGKDGRYFVGNLALRQSTIKHNAMQEDKSKSWISKVLFKTGLGMVCGDETIYLVTGLPIAYYHTQKESLLKMIDEISGQVYDLKIGKDVRKVCPVIEGCKIVPQPLGSALNYLLDGAGNFRPQTGRILVVDVGFYTLDLLIVDNLETSSSSCSPKGVSVDMAYRIIQQGIMARSGALVSRFDIDRFLQTRRFRGEDVGDIIDGAFRALAGGIEAEIENLNDGFDRFILTGGVAAMLRPFMRLPADRTIVMSGQGNVEGYLKLGAKVCQM